MNPVSLLVKPAAPLTALAVGAIAVAATLLPSMAQYLATMTQGSVDQWMLLRVAVLTVAYSLVAGAAYRRAQVGFASAAAVLWGAALGWSAWGWDNALRELCRVRRARGAH